MPFSRRFVPRVPWRGWRHAAVGAGRALSPRGALTLHDVDGAFFFAVRAALAMGLVGVPIVQAGRPDLAVYAMLGSFTTTFGRNLPYDRRARVLAVVAVAMTACVGCGSALAAWAGSGGAGGVGTAAAVAATAVVAGLAKFICDATRLSGLGAVLLLFAFAVAANGTPTGAEVLPHTALAAAGAAFAWLLAVSGRLVHPDRPQRLAVATALRKLAELLDASAVGDVPGRTRHAATVAALHAYYCLGLPPPTPTRRAAAGRDAVFVRLTDLSWTLLIGSVRRPPGDPVATARHLRRQARLLTDRRRRVPPALTEPLHQYEAPTPSANVRNDGTPSSTSSTSSTGTSATSGDPAVLRATTLLIGRPGGPDRLAALAVPALRMALGTGVAGGLAAVLNLEHGYWAAISAAAVLHSVNLRTTAQRAVQRTLGTALGLLLALGVLAAHPKPVELALVIVVLEFLLEYVAARNYALAVVFLTPIALLLSDLAAPSPAGELVLDRVLGSAVGIAVGLGCALLIVHDRAAVRVERALAACKGAAERAERALSDPLSDLNGTALPVVQVSLAMSVVELREADDTAAGELWPAEIDPTELAAAEQRAYLLLHRLHGLRS
ncbi:FUSC family protein [Streptomyces sp. RPA4-2]|uniref:FUSC family protein n=1 Tax=Streptomyces sp. RPA4-2 TaxID=2721244 RepID=UPI00143E5427|nr:FUSC family protein [Streptomyces sp. RPA4-2]QIY67018.1 FUSC family protein [Streptomyces sp. RPA4-2]